MGYFHNKATQLIKNININIAKYFRDVLAYTSCSSDVRNVCLAQIQYDHDSNENEKFVMQK